MVIYLMNVGNLYLVIVCMKGLILQLVNYWEQQLLKKMELCVINATTLDIFQDIVDYKLINLDLDMEIEL